MIPVPDLTLRMGDTLPRLEQQLRDRDGLVYVIPDEAEISFVYRRFGMPDDRTEVSGSVDDADTGLVSVQIATSEMPGPGRYQAFWKVLLSDDEILSFPNDENLWLQITP